MRISDWSSDVCSSDLSADGSFVKRGKQDFERLAKALFDLKPDTGEGNRRQRVLQGKEISGSLLAHQIGTGGERLTRSEEHTSELQSLMRISYAVFCLKQKQITTYHRQGHNYITNYI